MVVLLVRPTVPFIVDGIVSAGLTG